MSEVSYEIDYDRQECLRALTSQAEGNRIDTTTDRFLIEQLNKAYVGDTVNGLHRLRCQVGECSLVCLTTNEQGGLTVQEEVGEAVCDN